MTLKETAFVGETPPEIEEIDKGMFDHRKAVEKKIEKDISDFEKYRQDLTKVEMSLEQRMLLIKFTEFNE